MFRQILSIDSTSGKERELAVWLARNLEADRVDLFEVGDGTANLMLSWGNAPEFVFCSHLDTVPPYIPPVFEETLVRGRGTCDAKGQFYAMYKACRILASRGEKNFALLLLAGEESGSYGAKAFARTDFRAPYLLIGEPTDNCMASASKGTKSYDVHFKGEAFHSGYPECGRSAVEMFVDFNNALREAAFPVDEELGGTTYNFGLLKSDNPQNILSPSLDCRLYFRTTFASDKAVQEFMAKAGNGNIEITARGGDTPARYHTIEGFPSKPVAFGSDAPHLTNFEHKMICGPGSIKVAHRDEEHLKFSDFEKAVENYIEIYYKTSCHAGLDSASHNKEQ